MRTMLSMAAATLPIICLSAAAAPLLAPADGGGWRTSGLPYTAVFSPQGYLESLQVKGFEFLAPSTSPVHGLFLVDGDKPLPFSTVTRDGDTLTMSNAGGVVTVQVLPARLELTIRNIAIRDGNCAQLELSKTVMRAKSPQTGVEYPLPPQVLSGPVRLIAANGANITVSGQYLWPSAEKYMMKLPFARLDGPETKCTISIAAAPAVDDLVKVEAKAASADFVYWSGGPQSLTTDVTNMQPDKPFRGAVALTLRPYLTKQVVQKMQQPISLPRGGTKSLSWTLKHLTPGLYLAEISVTRGKERGCCCVPRFVYDAAHILPAPTPADFAAFWQRTLEEQARIPLDLQMTKVKDWGKSELYKFSFAGLLGYRCYGYLTVPQDKSTKHPAVLILPSSGLHSLQPPPFSDGTYVGMAINISNVDVDLPEVQYDWRTWPAPYLVTGILDRNHYSLRFSYAALVRTAELLAARPEVQADNILVTGSSQGGGLTLIAAALYPKFKAAVANVPALCRLDWSLDYLNPPYFPIAANADTHPWISRTLSYYDATQFARDIHCPIWISLGLMDDVTPSMGVFCAYNVIPSTQKHLLVQPLVGHGGGYDYMTVTRGVWP